MADLSELLADKMAMESLKWESLEIERKGPLGTELDVLCAQNTPGYFPQLAEKFGLPSPDHILQSLMAEELDIAVTPQGNADAPVDGMFAKPYVTRQSLEWLLNKLQSPDQDGKHYYFQSQDDNLNSLAKKCMIPRKLDHGSRFLGEQQAANLWIGGEGTTSRLHNDNFDNIYVQLSGTKRVYLIPPGCVSDVDEKPLVPATYNSNMQLVKDRPSSPDYATVWFPTYNPSKEPRRGWQFAVDLRPGDVLFLPALWYHQIEILGSDVNVSINYWHTPFDDELRWAQWNFTRQVANSLKGVVSSN